MRGALRRVVAALLALWLGVLAVEAIELHQDHLEDRAAVACLSCLLAVTTPAELAPPALEPPLEGAAPELPTLAEARGLEPVVACRARGPPSA